MRIRMHLNTHIGNKDKSLNFHQETLDKHCTTLL